jgi:hypothetical protein
MHEPRPILQSFNLTEEPVRHGSKDNDIRLDFRGNFERAVEVTSDTAARQNARRGK